MTNGPRRLRRAVPAVVVALLFVGGALAVLAPGTVATPLHPSAPVLPAGPATGPARASPAPLASHAASARHAPPSHLPPPVSSGRGTFYDNWLLGNVPAANDSCSYDFACMNNSFNPSITSTPAGVIATAYTEFTNINVCSGQGTLVTTEIGINVSTNSGTTWGPAVYLDNPNCATQFNYTSAMYPTIGALSNGTLVLAYIEYNITMGTTCFVGSYIWFPAVDPCYVSNDSLVFTESYNNGTTWTLPTVINATSNPNGSDYSQMAFQPNLATYGNSIYLAWTNFTQPVVDDSAYAPSVGLNMVTSTNGGATWGPQVQLPVIAGNWSGSLPTWVAYQPSVIVNATGTVFVAYTSDVNYQIGSYCDGFGCAYPYPEATASVVLATSTSNGSAGSWSLVTVASDLGMAWNDGSSWTQGGPGSTYAPVAAVAADPTSGELYIAYTAGLAGQYCDPSCFTDYDYETLYVANSTDGGATWSTPVNFSEDIIHADGHDGGNWLMTPSIAVNSTGVVFVDAPFDNNTYPCSGGFYCDYWSDLMFTSTDQGASFTWVSPYVADTWYGYPLDDGMTTGLTILNGTPYAAWTVQLCPGGPFTYCSSPGGLGWQQIDVSSPFSGAGVTVTFSQSGLPVGANWSINLEGNVRSGGAATNLVVSGVPTGQVLLWSSPWVNLTSGGYGVSWASTFPGGSSGTFSAAATVSVVFSEYVLLNVSAVPPGNAHESYWCPSGAFFAFYCSNQEPQPFGPNWLPINTPVPYSITDVGLPANCIYCDNLSFLSWSGTGAGSWNTTNPNGTTVLAGPVNESANFQLLNVCDFGRCTNITYAYSFVETGLPSGTLWEVNLAGTAASSTTAFIGFNASQGPLNYTVLSVPVNATWSYFGTPSIPSPITSFQGGEVVVNFTLENDSNVASPVTFDATGLPAGVTQWGLELGTASYGVGQNATFSLPGRGVTLNASPVYGANGVGGYVTNFLVTPLSTTGTSFSVAPGSTFTPTGPAIVVAQYSPEFWFTTTTNTGGTVNAPSGQWVHSGATVDLTATPNAGYAFVSWSGTGSGSITSTSASIAPQVTTSPIAELATFVAVVPTYSVAVTASGLPDGVPITVEIGSTNLTLAPPFNLTGFVSGTYPLVVPTVYPNGTAAGVRYTVTGATSSLTLAGGTIAVTADGTLAITYSAEYALTVGSAANGTSTPTSGTYWETGGVAVPLVGHPNTGYLFVSWNGTGLNAVASANATVSVTLTAPLIETPTFTLYIPPPAMTYSLTLGESGLPTGVSWSAATSGASASGSGSLVLSGLNGSTSVAFPTVYTGLPGVRYVPAAAVVVYNVTGNLSETIQFTTQYLVTISAGSGGTVNAATGWFNASTAISLAATPATGEVFLNWTGTGSGAYSGISATGTATVSGPITEVANFGPAPTSGSSSNSGFSAYALPIGLLVALLVVGLVIGLVIARSRRPPTGGAPTPEMAPAETAEVPTWSEESTGAGGNAPPPGDASGPETSGGGDGEGIYGGGTN